MYKTVGQSQVFCFFDIPFPTSRCFPHFLKWLVVVISPFPPGLLIKVLSSKWQESFLFNYTCILDTVFCDFGASCFRRDRRKDERRHTRLQQRRADLNHMLDLGPLSQVLSQVRVRQSASLLRNGSSSLKCEGFNMNMTSESRDKKKNEEQKLPWE